MQQAEAEGLTLLRSEISSTGYRGVSFDGSCKGKPYKAYVRRGGENVHLGHCATAEEAALCVARTPEMQVAMAAAAAAPPEPPPLTAEEAVQQAEAEGLTLLRSESSSTGYKGVSFNSGMAKPYRAEVRRGGKLVSLGSFVTAEEAALCHARTPEAQAAMAAAAAAPPEPPPLTAEEAVQQAEAEGLMLLRSESSSTGYKGVSIYSGRYRAVAKVYIGIFATLEEAALHVARASAAQAAAAAPPKPPPLTAEEALREAEAEGLTLLRSESIKTGYKGVSFNGSCKSNPYQAYVWRGGKVVNLGRYATAEEAALCHARTPEAQAAVAAAAAPPAPPPMTAEEALRQAEAEGLTLLRTESTSTGYKGVSFNRNMKTKSYHARVQRGGKDVNLGRFATAEEAALSYARSPEAQAAVAAAQTAAAAAQAAAAAPPAPPPMRAEEALRLAEVEGLTLRRSESSSTGYWCVSFNSGGRYTKPNQARVQRGGKNVHLGSFATPEEAALCYARSPEGRAAAAAPPPPPPLTAEEALRQAEAEGLTLLRSGSSSTGYKGVRFNSGGNYTKPNQATVWRFNKLASLGYFTTSEEAALHVARASAAQAAAPQPTAASSRKRKVKSEEQPPDTPADVVVILDGQFVDSWMGRAKQTAKRSAPKPAGGSGGGASSRKRQAAAAADSAADEEEEAADAPRAARQLRAATAALANAADARGDPVQEVLAGADKRKRAAGSSSQQKAAKASAAAPASAPRATTNPSASTQASSVQWDEDGDGNEGVSAPSLNPTAARTIQPLQTTGGTPNGSAADGGSPAVPGGPKGKNNSHREVKKTKRVPFSTEENNYVRQGYEEFKTEKTGMWVKILKAYPFNPTRTSVDIKDKHRNLMKKDN